MRNRRRLFFLLLLIGIVATVSSKTLAWLYEKNYSEKKETKDLGKAERLSKQLRKKPSNSIYVSSNISTQSNQLMLGPTDCSDTIILQKDTIVCPGTTLTLRANPEVLKDTIPAGFWKQLVTPSQIDAANFNIKPFGFDRTNQVLYSILNGKIYVYRLGNNDSLNRVDTINAANWPGNKNEQFVFDPTGNKIFLWRSGRDTVSQLDLSNPASWQFASNSNLSVDNSNIFANSFWDGVRGRPAFYGGYGGGQVKNSIFGFNGTTWVQLKANTSTSLNPPKGGKVIGSNANNTKIYIFSGYGSEDGFAENFSLTDHLPYGTIFGTFSWLRHIWEIDLNAPAFTPRKILNYSHPSVQYEGAVAYDYDKNRFYKFGGFQPTDDFIFNEVAPTTNKSFRFRVGVDSGFVEYTNVGIVPPPVNFSDENGLAYYDSKDKKIIWARNDGIWAFYPDSTTETKLPRAVSWINLNTGASLGTSENITVTPTTTTRYQAIVSNYGVQCFDTVTITVDSIPRKLPLRDTVCGIASITLNASDSLIETYEWHKVRNLSVLSTQDSITINNPAVTVPVTDTFYVKLKSTNNVICSRNDTIIVTFYPPISLNTIVQKNSVCVGDSNRVIVPLQQGISYTWVQETNPFNVLSTSNQLFFPSMTANQQGRYVVSANYIGLNGACPILYDTTTSILVSNSITVTIQGKDANNNIYICDNNPRLLDPAPNPTSNNYNFSWVYASGQTRTEVSNTQFYTVNPPNGGIYSVRVRNQDSTCFGVDSALVQFFAPINIDLVSTKSIITDTVSICLGDALTLYLKTPKQQNVVYSWAQLTNNGQLPSFTTSSDTAFTLPNNLVAGTYRYILFGSYTTGCTIVPSDTITVNILARPIVTFLASNGVFNTNNDSLFVCGNNTVLRANTGVGALGYVWNPTNSSTTDSIYNINTAGLYKVNVTDVNNICSSIDSIIVVFATPINPVIASTDTTICSNGSVVLEVKNPQSSVTYNWSLSNNPAIIGTGNSIAVQNLSAGIYNYVVTGSYTNNSTCNVITDTVRITVNTAPTVSITYNGNAVLNNSLTLCNVNTATLVATSIGGNNFSWNTLPNPTLSNSLNVTNDGKYIVTVSNGNCSVSDSVVVNNNAASTASINGILTVCGTSGTTLTATSNKNVSYAWNTGSTNSSITVGVGTYTVTVTDSCGATGTATVTVLNNNAAPTASINGILTVCGTSGTTLTATSNKNVSYAWNTGSTNSSITVGVGTYTVTVTDSCGATGTATVTVVNNNAAPTASINGILTVCGTSGTTLTATSNKNVSYAWNTGSTNSSITVGVGTYTVTVTDSCGATGTATVTVLNNNAAPTASINGILTVCGTSGTTLTATSNKNVSYAWNTGSTNSSITVGVGTYTVTVTDSCGATGTATVTVVNNNAAPTASINGILTVCGTSGTTLTATSNKNVSYAWNTGSTNSSITVGVGTYTVTVTDSCGATGTATVTVVNNNAAPTTSINGILTVCGTSGTTLTATSNKNVSYAWNTGSTNSSITVGVGTYTVTVTDSCGATGTATVTVVNNNAAPTASINGILTVCGTSGTTLTATSNKNVSYAWNTGSTNSSITVGAGTYTVTVTDSCGATGTATVTVVNNNAAPTTSINGILTVCGTSGTTLTVTSNKNVSYAWNTGSTNSSITVGVGTYTVTVTDSCGATGTATVTVVNNNAAPTASINGILTVCGTSGTTLTATSNKNVSYAWNTGSTNSSITVGVGTYTVTVTDSCGATGTATVTVVNNNAAPTASINGILTVCGTSGTTLTATSNKNVSYAWNTGSTNSSITVGVGTYTVTVTDSCGATGTATVTVVNNTLTPTLTLPPTLTSCIGTPANLVAGPNDPSVNYLWNTGETTNSINVTQSNIYEVTATNACSTVSKQINVQFVAAPVVNLPTNIDACISTNTVLDAGTNPIGTTYLWNNNGATTPSITVNNSGNYTVTATNGCATVTKSVQVNYYSPITISLPATTSICLGNSVTLNPGNSNGATYLWTTGATTPSITVNTAGNYSVMATNSCGSVTASTNVVINTIPVVVLPASITECSTTPVTLDAGNAGAVYLWSNGATSQMISVTTAGNYSVTVINGNNCSVTSNPVSVSFVAPPVINLPAITTACANASVVLNAGNAGSSYLWNTGATTQNITVTASGNYTVSVSNAVCTTPVTATTSVQFLPAINTPNITVARDSICSGQSITLSVNPVQSGINYAWSVTGNPTVLGTGNSITIPSVSQTTSYTVTASNSLASCGLTTSNKIITVVPQLSTPVVSATNITGVSITFQWSAVPNATGYLISTDNGVTFRSPTNGATALSETINGLLPLQTVNFSVQAIGTFSCQPSVIASTTATTTNPIGNLIYVPNSFTPNNDGINDVFTVYGNTIQSIRLTVYNQLGQQLVVTTDRLRGWDGTHKGTKQPVGVYVYFVEAVLTDGTTQVKKGTFTLLR